MENKNKKIIILSFIVLLIDQLSKFIVKTNLNLLDTITVINKFLYITYTRNIGGAFSILEGKQLFLIIISVIFLILLIYYIIIEKNKSILSLISYSFIMGGVLGNLVDRVFNNYVIDFISVNIFGYYFPIFNMADLFIVVGFILLIIDEVEVKLCKKL